MMNKNTRSFLKKIVSIGEKMENNPILESNVFFLNCLKVWYR